MAEIASVKALEILDSRGCPTLQVTVTLTTGVTGTASVPSGASVGDSEAVELRDQDQTRYSGKGVRKAVDAVHYTLRPAVEGQNVFDQAHLDRKMVEVDGTQNKSRLGANSILGVSLAIARAAAHSLHIPLYRYIGGVSSLLLPCPMLNIINGGAHASNSLDFQEFMIFPLGASSCSEAIRWGAQVIMTLKELLEEAQHISSLGDEGGFAPRLSSNEEALDYIVRAIESAGFRPGEDIAITLDAAASEFYDPLSDTYIEQKKKRQSESYAVRTAEEQIAYFDTLCARYPIVSIEDPLDQNDWSGWSLLMEKLGKKIQVVGDDLFVTHMTLLKKGIAVRAANAILIKLNQIGTLTETLQCIQMAKRHGFRTIISHRSGETGDTFIADLAVGTGAGQIKTGSLARGERIAKYNRLLEIEHTLGQNAIFANKTLF